jgi:hypothetical protein
VTCGCVAEYAVRRALDIEHRANSPSVVEADALVDVDHPGHPAKLFTDVFETRGALSAAEEELVRLLQRQFDADISQDDFRRAARKRYERALAELRAAAEELRLLGDWLRTRVEALQIKHADRLKQEEHRLKEQEQDRAVRRQLMLTVVGTFLIVPTLVASVFQDDYKLPDPNSTNGLIGMLLLMVGLSGVALSAIWQWLVPRVHNQSPQLLPTLGHVSTAGLSVAAVVIGVVVLLLG